MSKQILVPVDGSRFSEAALGPALRLARRMGARIEIVTAHEPFATLDYPSWEAYAVEWADTYLQQLVERLAVEGVEVTTRAVAGPPADVIQQAVKDSGADLVVMASHGRGAFSRVWLGSTSDAFIRHSTVPVLLVKPAEDETEEHADHPFEHMLIPMDGSELAERVLDCAIDLGHTDGVKYTLLRVFPYPAEFASAYLPHTVQVNAAVFEEGKLEAEEYVKGKAAELREKGFMVDAKMVVDANPGAGILHTAEEVGADIIAMSTHGRGGLNRLLLGSVTDKVLRASKVPVLVFRPKD